MKGYTPVPNPAYPLQNQSQEYPQAPSNYLNAPFGYESTPNQTQNYLNQQIPQTVVLPTNYFGFTYSFILDPMEELALSKGVLIRQQPKFFEQMSGCELPNRYFVFSQSPQTGFKMLFKCKEQSECFQRNCYPPSRKEFHMDLEITTNAESLNDNHQNSFIHLYKPFKCTCCCLERPVMIANYSSSGDIFGKIDQPFNGCNPIFTLYDDAGSLRYYIYAECFQCGLCCNGPCSKMYEVVFNIYRDVNMEKPIGNIIKKIANYGELVTRADSYQINFPADAKPNEKLLLIITGLMIDYQYFEKREGENGYNG